jgi:hypothetical protein
LNRYPSPDTEQKHKKQKTEKHKKYKKQKNAKASSFKSNGASAGSIRLETRKKTSSYGTAPKKTLS